MLVEAVQSALDQTFTDFEIIVIDDGSNTAREALEPLAETAAGRDIGLYVMDMERNTGYYAKPRNLGMLRSTGSYLAFLDDDNIWDPEHLDVLVTEIEKMGCDAVYSRWRYEGDGPMSGKEFPFTQMTQITAAGLVTSPQNNFIDTSAMLISKAAFIVRMGHKIWDEERQRFGDWDLVARSLGAGLRWRGIDRVTFTYRWHGENLQLTRAAEARPAGIVTKQVYDREVAK